MGIKTATAVAAVGLAATGFLWMTGAPKLQNLIKVPAYSVLRVIDGDTFETTEHQHIRVAAVEAPEIDLCGGPEAKKALEKLVLGKPVYLKVIYRDPYQRLVSLVYAGDQFVNKAMLADGLAYHHLHNPLEEIGEDLKNTSQAARERKIGIFGPACTQMTNSAKPKCDVKGNTRNGNIYYRPDCGVYPNVAVQLYLGDRWFCSEKEAIKAGFRKPEQCP